MVRDKDAVSTACLFSEVAMRAKEEGMTLVDRLHELYQRHGVHREKLSQIAFPEGAAGMQQMQALMQKLRINPPQEIAGQKVVVVEDYLSGTRIDANGVSRLTLPKSDVLRFWLSDQSKLVIRPSGTEPKIKIYAEVVAPAGSDLAKVDAKLDRLEVS
jgi:phosphomannomutase